MFVDVDGVLNVGVRDGGRAPLLLDEASARAAQRLWATRMGHPEQSSIERLVAVCNRALDEGEDGETFAKFLCASPQQFSEELLARFAAIVRASGWRASCDNSDDEDDSGDEEAEAPGHKVHMVLTSTWRAPQHRSRLRKLEQAISKQLGEDFEFDLMTPPKEDHTPEGRLQSIANFLTARCAGRTSADGPMRVLVLDDFYNRSLNGWLCGPCKIDSETACEKYLRSSIPSHIDAQVKMIHTYAEWTTEEGLFIQVGTGLMLEQVRSGEFFFQGAQAETSSTSAGSDCEEAPVHRSETGSTSAGSESENEDMDGSSLSSLELSADKISLNILIQDGVSNCKEAYEEGDSPPLEWPAMPALMAI